MMDELRAKAELIGLAEPMERLARFLEAEPSGLHAGGKEEIAAWGRWLHNAAAKCRAFGTPKDSESK